MLDALLDAGDYDVVFIESIDSAYAQIKRSRPHVVVLCVDMDDAGCFQIMSMLNLDSDTSQIPVISYVAGPGAAAPRDRSLETDRDPLSQPVVLSMN
jgi:PleD family two-component response regulator